MDNLTVHFAKYWGLWILGSIAVIIVYSLYRWSQSPNEGGKGKIKKYDVAIYPDLTIEKGYLGETAKSLQANINMAGKDISEDGNFGEITEAALYQLTGKKKISLNDFSTWYDSGAAPFIA